MPDCPPTGHPPFARTVETPKRPCAAGRRGAWGCGEVSPQVSPQLAGEAAGAISGLPACGSACRCLPWRRPCWWAASGSRPWLVGIPFSARHHTVAVGVHQPRVHAHIGLGSGLAAGCAGVDLCYGGCTALAGSGVSGSCCAAAGALVDLVLGRRGCHTARCRGVHFRGWAGGVVARCLGQCGGAGEGSECSENGLLMHGMAPWWKLNNSIPEDTCSPLLEGVRADAVGHARACRSSPHRPGA